MNPAERLEDHHSRVLDEVIQTRNEKEVIDQDGLTVPELLLSTVKVKVDIEILDEAGDGVLVGVGLLLDHLDQVLHHIPPDALVDDDRCGQVSQDPRAGGLDCVQVGLLVEEQLDDQILALVMVEEHEETPVDQPGPLLQGLQVTPEGALINELLQPEKFYV